jgi:SAM-dependent methyltransferase
LVCEQLAGGVITAIDRSATAVARARRRNRGNIAAGRARIEQRALADADFRREPLEGPFGKAFAVNVNAFWTAPSPSFAAVRRALPVGGRLYLAYQPPSSLRLNLLRDQLRVLVRENGFRVVDERVRDLERSSVLCVIAERRRLTR